MPQIKQSRAVAIPKMVYMPGQMSKQPPQLIMPQAPPVTYSTEYVRRPPLPEYVRSTYPITAGQYGSHSLHDAATNNLQPLVSQKFIEQHKPDDDPVVRTTISSLSRAMLALKSGIIAEMNWASKFLIKASYELADDFILEKVSGLCEILLTLVSRGIDSLSTKHQDQEDSEAMPNGHATNGDLRTVKRIKLDSQYFEKRKKCSTPKALEAALILRNLCLQPENAKFILRSPLLADILTRGLRLCDTFESLEMKQYCVEICDSIPPTLQINSEDDPLYLTLSHGLDSDDRSLLLSSLRSLSRLSIADENNRLLQDIKPSTIARLIQYLQLDDVELLCALNAFFFQFTTYRINTAALVKNPEIGTLVRRLLGLTMWNAQDKSEAVVISESQQVVPEVTALPPPPEPPHLSEEIIRELLTFQEPERAIHWMRACFEVDKEAAVTQILLWQSYRTLFTPFSLPTQNGTVQVSGKPLLQAADVIKMVGTAFNGAMAMVTNHPSEGQKFIVRGIRCRRFPVAPSGKKYVTCQWITESSDGKLCSLPYATAKDMYAHVIEKHVRVSEGSLSCAWKDCKKYIPQDDLQHRKIAAHLKIHVSDYFEAKKPAVSVKTSKINIANQVTAQDEKGEPKGVALTASLTLRNIAKADHNLFQSAGRITAERDLLLNISLNPVLAPQAGEVLSALR